MSLISASDKSNSTWGPIQDATVELRNGCEALEQSLEQIFHELEDMRKELVDRIMEVEQERLLLESRGAEIDQQCEQLRGDLQRQVEELGRAREELDRQRVDADDDLRAELESARHDLQTQQCELEAIRLERDGLKQQVARQPDEDRLVALEAELAAARQQLRGGTAITVQRDAEVDPSMTLSGDRLSELEYERDALEAELELVRNRAAELDETVAEQQRALSEQKSVLSGELQQLRRLVEKQAELFATRDESIPQPVVEVVPEPAANTQMSDPVVHSVMAQFAKLQKDVARRRQ